MTIIYKVGNQKTTVSNKVCLYYQFLKKFIKTAFQHLHTSI